MKKVNVTTSLLTIATVAVLCSCGTSRIADFSAQKYTNFERGSTAGLELKQPAGNDKKELYAGSETRYLSNEDLKLQSSNREAAIAIANENTLPGTKKELKKLIRSHREQLKTNERPGNSYQNPREKTVDHPSPNTQINPKDDDEFIIEIILSFLLPPLAVYLHTNEIGYAFWICLILTFMMWLPGVIFAILVVGDIIK